MLAASENPDGITDPLASYDYHLPPELIAQHPARRRVQARMLVLPRAGGPLAHDRVARLTKRLGPGDLLVMNDTRVVPARLAAHKPTGGKVEILLLSPAQPQAVEPGGAQVHQVLTKGLRPGCEGMDLRLAGEPKTHARVLKQGARGKALVRLEVPALELAWQRGQTPLPPYIKRPQGPHPGDRERYQTVYAAKQGAVAAPTAGLHLSPELLAALKKRGAEAASLTLHVGYGTFAEPAPEDLMAGRLHAEWVEIPPQTARAVAAAKARGGRVIAVGTTSLRALEWRPGPDGAPRPGSGWCDILIGPGHRFRVADGILTNFHLPRTTLLMLVAAMAERRRVLKAYAEAVKEKYRFYSFGDAMLIL